MAGGYYDPGYVTQQAGQNLGTQNPLQYLQANPNTTPFQGWNAGKYLESNPDLVAAWNNGSGLVNSSDPSQGTLGDKYGTLDNWALNHYNMYGINEARGYEGMPTSVRDYNSSLITNPQLPPGTAYEATTITPQAGEMVNAPQLDPGGVQATQTQAGPAQQATAPNPQQAATYDPSLVNEEDVPQVEAEQGTVSENAQVTPEQGTLNPEISALLDPYMAEVPFDERSLVQYQYEQLTNFDPMNPPNWAKGAMREAMARMAGRGMGSSSMAAEAISASILQAALPIASQDAKVFENLMLKKLDQKAQATFLKAGYLAQMDMKNLDNRQQAAIVNAQAFLSMDLANLANRQQAAIVNTQGRIQAMLSNQAAINAARQFNAASTNQMTMFYDQLGAQIQMFNASQVNDMSKFNAGQANAISMFNANLKSQREQFNLSLDFAAQQSNAQWLRQINTLNTQAINQQNMVNTQNLFNMSTNALNNEMLLLRDQEKMIFDAGQREADRNAARAIAIFNNDNLWAIMDEQNSTELAKLIGDSLFWATNAVLS